MRVARFGLLLVAAPKDGNVEGQIPIGGLLVFRFGIGALRKRGALRVDAKPVAANTLEDVGEYALVRDLIAVDLMAQHVGAVHHGDVAHQAYGDDLLGEIEQLVIRGNEICNVLVARGDVTGCGDIYKERGEHQLEAILVMVANGLGPGVLNLLELLNLRAYCGRHAIRDGRSGRTLGKHGTAGKQ